MSPDPQAASREPENQATVLAWGAVPEPGPDPLPGPRRSATGLLRDVRADRRLVPLTAALGGFGVFLSLVSEWQVTAVDAAIFDRGETGPRPVRSGLAELGAWGSGYLVGLFLLVVATGLLLYGPVPGRRYARVAALSAGGGLLAMLIAAAADLDRRSQAIEQIVTVQIDPATIDVTLGRGVWCAVAGVAAITLASHLAGRQLPTAAGRQRPTTAATAVGADGGIDGGIDGGVDPGVPAGPGTDGHVDWRWRPHPPDDEPPEVPLELTVSPATPLHTPVDDRDTLR